MSAPSVRDLHDRAMRLSMDALVLRETRHPGRAQHLSRRACFYEARAASLIELRMEHEPTRSILYQSAAACALHGGQPAKARRLIAEARAGWPPPRVQMNLDEIESMLEDA